MEENVFVMLINLVWGIVPIVLTYIGFMFLYVQWERLKFWWKWGRRR